MAALSRFYIAMLIMVQILNFRIYCLGPPPSDISLYPNSTRIQYYFEPIRPREELTSYMESQSGKMVVTGRCIPERLPLFSFLVCLWRFFFFFFFFFLKKFFFFFFFFTIFSS